jgi:NADH:quinone reductase (non-electrogenic)
METLTLPPHRHGDGKVACDASAAARDYEMRPHVVIVGAGFAGLTAAKALAQEEVSVTVIDRRNHHLFQPLLYQVATAALSPAQIAAPIRAILRTQKNATVLLGDVTGVDSTKREVVLSDATRISYDYLVLATGAQHSYFGHESWRRHAPGLKSLEDATGIRRRILIAFERAEASCDMEEKHRLLTFIIVGAGPTGVELAGAIAEISRHALASDFRNIDPKSTRVVLVEAGPRVLPVFPESLSGDAKRRLEKLGVNVFLNSAVSACDAGGVTIGETRLESRTILWAAGVAASPAAKWLGVPADRAGRVLVSPDLSVPSRPEIFVIGDTANVKDAKGAAVPGLAPAAKQQGQYVARVIAARTRERANPAPFVYRNLGNLATIGRKTAVADLGRFKFTGFAAWLLWSVAHVFFLIGFKNRISVAIDWLWSYLTFERGARLISQTAPDMPTDTIAVTPRMSA